MNQLSLFSQSDLNNIFIEKAPFELAPKEDSYFIIISRVLAESGKVKKYEIPISFTRKEASIVLNELKGFDWQLKERKTPDGLTVGWYPTQLQWMMEHMEHLVNNKLLE